MDHPRGRDVAEAGTDSAAVTRLLAFSDGTFAIALTLLVLELRPPSAQSPAAFEADLQNLVPHFASYIGTFAVVGVFWLAHMSYMRRLVMYDWPTTLANLLLLFWIALTPFASATLGEHGIHPGAWRIYGAVMIGASLSQSILWLVASRGRGRLMGGVHWRERAFRTLRGLAPGIAFAVGYWLIDAGRMDLVPWSPLLIVPVMLLAGLLFGWRHPQPV